MFDKRIKRQILSRQFQVFLECAGFQMPGLLRQLEEMGFAVEEAEQDGLWILAGLRQVYELNLSLRFARRVWISLGEIKAGAREELFKRCLAVPWELWIPGPEGEYLARLRASALKHEGKAAATLEEAVRRYWSELPREGRGGQAPQASQASQASQTPAGDGYIPGTGNSGTRVRILLRHRGTRGRLLLDSTGDQLGRRGYRLAPGAAPIAEHLAAWLVAELQHRVGPPREGGWVVDGMSGSGTLLWESLLLLEGLSPGAGRAFACMGWPNFQEASFRYSRRTGLGGGMSRNIRFLGIELDQSQAAAWRTNLEALRTGWVMEGAEGVTGLGDSNARDSDSGTGGPERPWEHITLVEQDFFTWSPRPETQTRGTPHPSPGTPEPGSAAVPGLATEPVLGWILLNPPYDIRLQEDQERLFDRMISHLGRSFTGWAGLLLVPYQRLESRIPRGWLAGEPGIFNHGGRKIRAFWLRIR